MNKIPLYFFLVPAFVLILSTASGQQVLTIQDIIQRAKSQSPASKQAETRKENRYWQYRFFRTNYNPQLRLSGRLPYEKQVTQAPLADGTFRYAKVNQFNSFVNLGLEQPIPWTAGTISVNSSLGYFNN